MMRITLAWRFHRTIASPLAGAANASMTGRSIVRMTGRALLTGAILLPGPAVAAERVALVAEEYTVPAPDPGINLFVRNKRPAEMTSHAAERTVLFVHGSTYPASTTFDLQLEGKSWMDFIAERGFDVYLMDLRGYGRSTRPWAMNEPPARNDPIVTTSEAVRDLEAVVDSVLQRRQIAKLTLIGWSWGTSITASYAVQHPERVKRLVFYGPQWIVRDSSPGGNAGKPGAYHTISRDAARERWLAGAPQDKQGDLIPSGWFEQWADATFASDPGGAAQEPPVLRAPSGTVLDSQTYWRAGKPFYDPRRITVPVLLVHGEWDRNTPSYMSDSLLPLLSNAPSRRRVVIPEATHMAMLEKNRMQLFDAVQRFLQEEQPPQADEQLPAVSDGRVSAPPDEPPVSHAPAPPSGGPDPPSLQSVAAASPAEPEYPETAAANAPSGPQIAEPGQSAVAASPQPASPPQVTAPPADQPPLQVAQAAAVSPIEGATPAELAQLMARGHEMMRIGDPASARLFYERAAARGLANGFTAVGRTYDPVVLQQLNIRGGGADGERALEWYRRGIEAGDAEAGRVAGDLSAWLARSR